MNRTITLLCPGLVAVAIAYFASTSATAQAPTPIPSVWLQGSAPGTTQTGHLNVSGTVNAGQFLGGGSGLTSVDADLFDGLNSTSFLQAIPVPLSVIGSNANQVIYAENSSASGGSAAIKGVATSGNNGIGGRFEATTSVGIGVYGKAPSSGTGSQNFGVFGEGAVGVYATSSLALGRALQGVATGSCQVGVSGSTSAPSGVGILGSSSATNGSGYGVSGFSSSPQGAGVHGESATSTGGYFTSTASGGVGVYANVSHTTGANYAVYGETASSNGTGVKGVVLQNNTTGVGVWGVSNSAFGWGVYADGRLGASGTKLFRIDHPLDPQNKWLMHYCSESPQPQNFYCGNVVTDESGHAWVELPDYFSEINKDFKYQLTVVDDNDSADFVLAKVSRKIRGNSFQIRTSAPNIEVSWRVEATRNDLWVRKNGTPIEEDKAKQDKGKYQHPELYGQPNEMGMSYRSGPNHK